MNHVVTESSPGELGRSCKCGQRFPTLKAAEAHAADQNLIEENEAKAAAARKSEKEAGPVQQPETEAVPEPTEADKKADDAAKAAESAAIAKSGIKAAEAEVPGPASQPAADDRKAEEAAPTTPTQTFADLNPLQQTQTLVKKYATSLLDDKRAGQFAATVALLARKNPDLAKATHESFLTAVMACVHLDLMPNTPEQYAFIIPYKNYRTGIIEAQFQLGYKGMQELAYRTGNVLKMRAELVFAEDTFDVEYAPDERIVHKPDLTIDRTKLDKVVMAYAIAKLANGETQFVVMNRSEIDKVRNSAKASSTDAPWNTWGTEMVRKSVSKRLSKSLPASTTDNRLKIAAEVDSLAEAGKLRYIEGEFTEAPKNALPSGIETKIAAATTPAELSAVLGSLTPADKGLAQPFVEQRLKEL
jgi:recombination protein RecT